MGKIASSYNADAFAPRPPGEVFEVAVATAGPGEFGVYVEVRVEAHRPIMPQGPAAGRLLGVSFARGGRVQRQRHPRGRPQAAASNWVWTLTLEFKHALGKRGVSG